MELWQHDFISGVFLADGTECKVVTGIDDHSRYCVLAKVVRRATGRQVCLAFTQAMSTYGIPDEVLTDNGTQFTGRLIKPSIAPRSSSSGSVGRTRSSSASPRWRQPTTTGKIERIHLTMRTEMLDDHAPFGDIEAAQGAFDTWRGDYNEVRPHQSLGHGHPGQPLRRLGPRPSPSWCSRPSSRSSAASDPLSSSPKTSPSTSADDPSTPPPTSVPSSSPGWCRRAGTSRSPSNRSGSDPSAAGRGVGIWADTVSVHVSLDGQHLKTVPSRLTIHSLASSAPRRGHRRRAAASRTCRHRPAGSRRHLGARVRLPRDSGHGD